MGMNPTIDISDDQRAMIVALLERHLPGTLVWAYGSRVTGRARPASDLDLVAFATAAQNRAVGDLREAFEDSNLPFRVDVFVWDEIPESFRKNIEADYAVMAEGKDSRK
ncbi:MAG: nucleotidyltransferase domain-containing protein [Planctomycetota bacterium]